MSYTAQQSAEELLSRFVATGARPGRSFPVMVGKPIIETYIVPTDGRVTVSNAAVYAWDGGVLSAIENGSYFALVSSSPSSGQYSQAAGVYQFNVGDALKKVLITYRISPAQPFVGSLQTSFLTAGYGLGDLVNGLAYAVSQGWLSTNSAPTEGYQTYTLEQAGWTDAGGTAPTIAASAQQLINVATALNGTPGGARFDLGLFGNNFTGTVGDNTFALEDLLPAYGYACSEGWVRPIGSVVSSVFSLTAAGAAAAS